MPLIFQYGSNTDADRLRDRLGEVDYGDRAVTIGEYTIAFDVWSQGAGCAASDLVEAPGTDRHAWGVLYDTSEAAFEKLKRIEGKYYEPKPIRVRDKDGNEVTKPVTAFLVKPEARCEGLWTSADYLGHIVKGLRDHGVPEEYTQSVIKLAIRTNKLAEDLEAACIQNGLIERLRHP